MLFHVCDAPSCSKASSDAASAATSQAETVSAAAQVSPEGLARLQQQQEEDVAFAAEICSLALLRFICDHRRHLQMTVTTLLLDQYGKAPGDRREKTACRV